VSRRVVRTRSAWPADMLERMLDACPDDRSRLVVWLVGGAGLSCRQAARLLAGKR
jgi:hypothetical protein